MIDKLRTLIEVKAPTAVSTNSSQKSSSSNSSNYSAVSLLAVDVTLMLLAIVAYAADELSQKDRSTIVTILKMTCVKGECLTFFLLVMYLLLSVSQSLGSPTAVIENCSSVLKCISGKFCEYDYLHPVVKGILELSSSTM